MIKDPPRRQLLHQLRHNNKQSLSKRAQKHLNAQLNKKLPVRKDLLTEDLQRSSHLLKLERRKKESNNGELIKDVNVDLIESEVQEEEPLFQEVTSVLLTEDLALAEEEKTRKEVLEKETGVHSKMTKKLERKLNVLKKRRLQLILKYNLKGNSHKEVMLLLNKSKSNKKNLKKKKTRLVLWKNS